MSRKTEPTVLKVLHGNPGKRRLPVEPQGQGELWSPPDYFDGPQREQWHYALDHAPTGLLTGADREVLALWCVAAVEYARAIVEVRKMGQLVKTVDGNVIQNPHLSIVNRQALILLKTASELGFSPAARASLGQHAPEFGGGSGVMLNGQARAAGLAAYLDEKPDRLS